MGMGMGPMGMVLLLMMELYRRWDRGMLGLAIHPEFPAKPYLYVTYSLNSLDDASQSPVDRLWPKEECPVQKPSPDTREFCATSGRLDRLRFDVNTNKATLDQTLISDWCSYRY